MAAVVRDKLLIRQNSNSSYTADKDTAGYFQPVMNGEWRMITDSSYPEDERKK